MESVLVVDLLDKVRKLFSDVLEAFEGQRIDRLDFSVFMKLSALALSYGFPRRPIEPTSPA